MCDLHDICDICEVCDLRDICDKCEVCDKCDICGDFILGKSRYFLVWNRIVSLLCILRMEPV